MTTERTIENSSQISKVKYNTETKVLTIQFKTGSIYEYAGVPNEVFDAFIAAESQGKYFSREIQGKYNFKFIG